MKATIISIGNSKGIRLPKTVLAESGLVGTVELKVKKGEIVITPALDKLEHKVLLNEEYLLSLSALSEWASPEEDAAWAHLQ